MASPLPRPAALSNLLLCVASLAFLLIPASLLAAQETASFSSSARLLAAVDAPSLPDAPLPQQQQLPKPSTQTSPTAPSLGDLGLTPAQIKPNTDEQQRLDRRTHDLKVHQELGLYTTIPILAACISGAGAVPDKNSYGDTTSRDVHVGIASLGIGMYAATAFYAIRAPRIPDAGPTRGGIKLHKYLIWIHAPGMILTPILGTMAFNDIASGHKPGGIEQYHSTVALTTAIAYGASIIAVSWPIHFKF